MPRFRAPLTAARDVRRRCVDGRWCEAPRAVAKPFVQFHRTPFHMWYFGVSVCLTSRRSSVRNTMIHRGPDASGICLDDHVGLAARHLSIIDIKRHAADLEQTGPSGRCSTVKSTITAVAPPAQTQGHRFATACDLTCAKRRRRRRAAAARHVRVRDLGCGGGGCFSPGTARQEAALLHARGRLSVLRRSQGAVRARRRSSGAEPRRAGSLSHVSICPRAVDALQGRAQAAAGSCAHGRRRPCVDSPVLGHGVRPGGARRRSRRSLRRVPPDLQRVRAAAPGQRRAGRRAALRRHRFERRRRRNGRSVGTIRTFTVGFDIPGHSWRTRGCGEPFRHGHHEIVESGRGGAAAKLLWPRRAIADAAARRRSCSANLRINTCASSSPAKAATVLGGYPLVWFVIAKRLERSLPASARRALLASLSLLPFDRRARRPAGVLGEADDAARHVRWIGNFDRR